MKKTPQTAEKRAIAGSEDDKKPELTEKEKLMQQASEEWLEFAGILKNTINAYYGTKDIQFTVQKGGWKIDLENIVVNVDPKFFLDKGYTKAEALFATFHEAEHFRDMAMDPEAYEDLFAHIRSQDHVHPAYPNALSRLYNCIDDVLVNKAVMSRWKAGKKGKDSLYPKLFPSRDLSIQKVAIAGPDGKPMRDMQGNVITVDKPMPRHRQFMYALLRKAMLPHEKIKLDPEVEQAIKKLEQELGPAGVELVTRVDAEGSATRISHGTKGETTHRFNVIKFYHEKIFKEFFLKDLEDRKQEESQKEGKGKGEEGDQKPGKGDPGEEPDDPFGDDPLENAIPDPFDYEDAFDKAQAINDRIQQKKNDEFKDLHGVTREDMDDYREDKRVVQEHIEEMIGLWESIITERKEYVKVLGRQPKKEGPLLHPARIASIPIETKAGNLEVEAYRGFEKAEKIRERPNKIEITLVCDGSSSMTLEGRGHMQRRLAILATESLYEFVEKINAASRAGEDVNLEVKSEIRVFTSNEKDEVLKRLSPELTHIQRIQMRKRLLRLDSGNYEVATFNGIREEQFTEERIEDLKEGNLKKLIIFLTDGESDAQAIQKSIKQLYAMADEGHDNLVIAAIGFGGGTSVKDTYAPNGHYVNAIQEVPDKFKEIIKKIMEDV